MRREHTCSLRFHGGKVRKTEKAGEGKREKTTYQFIDGGCANRIDQVYGQMDQENREHERDHVGRLRRKKNRNYCFGGRSKRPDLDRPEVDFKTDSKAA